MWRFWTMAGMAAILDGVTKTWAMQTVPFIAFNLGQPRFGLGLVSQVVITVVLIAMMIGLVIRYSPVMPTLAVWTGLATGGAVANTISIYSGPPGVLDFIPAYYILFNVADLCIWTGSVGMIAAVAKAARQARNA